MSLTKAKMTGSLKDQLLQEEQDLEAELAAVKKGTVRAGKKDEKKQDKGSSKT